MDVVRDAGALRHALAVYDGSAAGRRAVAQAASVTAEHDASLTIITLVVHDRQIPG
ncbi:MAG: hypothetical protein AB7V58_10380 [Solirubrobacterales bacterium]